MKIYDISQELFSCCVFPGDPVPEKQIISSIEYGDLYNLTSVSMCAHNGTHIDAPFHFFAKGKTVDDIPLSVFVGNCYLTRQSGEIDSETALKIVEKAREYMTIERILIAGNAVVTETAARVFSESGVKLLGNESQTVGPKDSPMAVHKILLGNDVVLLEGIRLDGIPDGVYFLNCAPLNLGGTDGAPCRAILVEM